MTFLCHLEIQLPHMCCSDFIISHKNKQFLEITKKIIESQATAAAENPFAFGYLLNVLYLYHQKPTEITIINDKNSELISSLQKKFLPESIMVIVRDKK